MGDYKKLRVWQLACEFADKVEVLARQLPNPERQWAFDQLVPAARAIHENIAEGCGFDSDTQLVKYLRQALATANESEDELLTLSRKRMLGDFVGLLDDVRRICAMLAVFRRKVEDSLARPPRRRQPRAVADSHVPAPEAKGQGPSEKPIR
jgi:four helix bundle protein